MMKYKNGKPFAWIGIGLGIFWWIFESIIHVLFFRADSFIEEILTKDSMEIWMRLSIIFIFFGFGIFAQITMEKLQKAHSQIKILTGLIPICANCKKIRDNKGSWNKLETYISNHSEAVFTHGICPECNKALYKDIIF